MDDPVGVRHRQGVAHGLGDLDGPLRHDAATAGQIVGERLRIHVLHDDEVDAVVGAGVVHGDQVGMVQACRGLRLAAEPRHEVRIAGVLGGQHLHGHGSAQDRVGALEHGGHAPPAELGLDLVPATEEHLGGHVVVRPITHAMPPP